MTARRKRDRRSAAKPVPADRRAPIERRLEDERRLTVRVPIDLWMEEVHGEEIYFRRSCNISEGGVFFDQSIPHPVGTNIMLRFELPGTAHEVNARGLVVSAARSEAGLGMGVKFTELPDAEQTALREYVEAMQAKRGTV